MYNQIKKATDGHLGIPSQCLALDKCGMADSNVGSFGGGRGGGGRGGRGGARGT